MKKRAPQLKLPGKCDPQTRWLLAYFLVTLLVQWGWQELFQQFAVRTIPYSQFKAHLERREVIDVAVKQDEIAGRIVPLAARQMNAAPTAPVLKAPDTNAAAVPIGLRRALAETAPFFFRTVRVDATFPLLVPTSRRRASTPNILGRWSSPCFSASAAYFIEGRHFVNVLCEMEGLNPRALHFRILCWLARSEPILQP